MQLQRIILIGIALILVGALWLLANIFQINFWAFCWPVGLILLGIYLLFKPGIESPSCGFNFHPLGDLNRTGYWQVKDKDILMFVGDVLLDMSQADIPEGETTIKVLGFVGDFDLILPKDAGVSIASSAFLTHSNVFGHQADHFLQTYRETSVNYETAEKQIFLNLAFFVTDVSVDYV